MSRWFRVLVWLFYCLLLLSLVFGLVYGQTFLAHPNYRHPLYMAFFATLLIALCLAPVVLVCSLIGIRHRAGRTLRQDIGLLLALLLSGAVCILGASLVWLTLNPVQL